MLSLPKGTPHSCPVIGVTTKKLRAGEELTIRYRPIVDEGGLWDPSLSYGFRCLCDVCDSRTKEFLLIVRAGDACINCHQDAYRSLAELEPVRDFCECRCTSSKHAAEGGDLLALLRNLRDVFPGSVESLRRLVSASRDTVVLSDEDAAEYYYRMRQEVVRCLFLHNRPSVSSELTPRPRCWFENACRG